MFTIRKINILILFGAAFLFTGFAQAYTYTSTSCMANGYIYVEGDRLQCINNSCVSDAYYVCRNGQWVIEGSMPKPKGCYSNGKFYPEGSQEVCVDDMCIADAYFVCMNGKWSKMGSYPEPIFPGVVDPPYTGSNDINTPPIITKVSGPVELYVNETGTWSVHAHDLEDSYLTFSVEWGDEPVYALSTKDKKLANPTYGNATFTHTYTKPGTYTIYFYVTDPHGKSTKTTYTVTVKQKSKQEPSQDYYYNWPWYYYLNPYYYYYYYYYY